MTLLEKYITDQILNANQRPETLWRKLTKTMLILLGMAWGLPWIWSSMSAAHIFPANISPIIAVIFAVGIVLTVGTDGWWIMKEATKTLDFKSPIEKKLFDSESGFFSRRIRVSLTWLFATLSCVAPVYAAVKYTSGDASQFLAIVTLIGCYGYGLVGYGRLIERISDWLRDQRQDQTQRKQKAIFINSIRYWAEQEINITDSISAEQWIKKIIADHDAPIITFGDNKLKRFLRILQLLFTICIPLAASMVNVFLIHDFLYHQVWAHAAFAIPVAFIAQIPDLMITTIATYQVFGKLFALLSNQSVQKPLHLTRAIPNLLALLAPTAAAYITYTTLTAHHMPSAIVLFGVIAISTARIVFSGFTLNHLITSITTQINTKLQKHHINRQIYLRSLVEMLTRIDTRYFARELHNY